MNHLKWVSLNLHRDDVLNYFKDFLSQMKDDKDLFSMTLTNFECFFISPIIANIIYNNDLKTAYNSIKYIFRRLDMLSVHDIRFRITFWNNQVWNYVWSNLYMRRYLTDIPLLRKNLEGIDLRLLGTFDFFVRFMNTNSYTIDTLDYNYFHPLYVVKN